MRVAVSVAQKLKEDELLAKNADVLRRPARNAMYALDAETGKLLSEGEGGRASGGAHHRVADILRRAAVRAGGIVWKTAPAGISATYPCCTFRGNVTALEAKTGKVLWRSYIITAPVKPTSKGETGVQHYGPAERSGMGGADRRFGEARAVYRDGRLPTQIPRTRTPTP